MDFFNAGKPANIVLWLAVVVTLVLGVMQYSFSADIYKYGVGLLVLLGAVYGYLSIKAGRAGEAFALAVGFLILSLILPPGNSIVGPGGLGVESSGETGEGGDVIPVIPVRMLLRLFTDFAAPVALVAGAQRFIKLSTK